MRRARTEKTGDPTARTFLTCFLRSYLIGANFNTRGLQNVGLFYAIDPGLAAIHGSGPALKKARKRYLRHFSSHPLWAPLLVAIFLSMEIKIARGELPAEMLEKVKNTTAYTLSALGDSLFGGSLIVFWSLCLAVLLTNDWHWAALAVGATFVLLVQIFKISCFVAGLREGFGFLQRLKRWDLINWSSRVKLVNAALLATLWGSIRPAATPLPLWLAASGSLACLAYSAERLGISRVIIAMAALALYTFTSEIATSVPAMF